MLDWDKPLSEQPQNIIDALERIGFEPKGRQANMLGQEFYKAWGLNVGKDTHPFAYKFPKHVDGTAKHLGYGVGREGASKMMQDLGIPGIRYLDGMSRGAGEGSMHYVLFDDALPRILEINGNPTGLLPWGAGEWGGLLK